VTRPGDDVASPVAGRVGGKVTGKVTGIAWCWVAHDERRPTVTTTLPALAQLDAEVARLAGPRAWRVVRSRWRDEPLLADFAALDDLLAHLRGSGDETDGVAARLVALAAAGDAAAVTVVLAALVGVFVACARRQSSAVDDVVADLLSLATEVTCTTVFPDRHVLAVLVSRVQSRHRRLRRRTRLLARAGDRLPRVRALDDPARAAVARVELGALGERVRGHLAAGTFTNDDWRRLVELRVLRRTSRELARRDALTAATVRKRAQRTVEALGVASRLPAEAA
jgi:hypothetical protein